MEHVGTIIWEMRTAAGWSLGALALRSGISKSALSRWESGARVPRIAELDAVLYALGASATHRAHAYSCIEAPRALRRLRSAEATAGLGPPPTPGDLLYAMRQRRGLTQEQVGAELGVGQPAIVRWERGDRLPSAGQMQAICYTLHARDEELIALTTGRFAESADPEPRGWSDRQACLVDRLDWHHYNRLEENGGGSDLEYIILERKAWLLAAREDRARPLLAQILAYHADAMRNQERWAEAGALARRALALIPRQGPEPDFAVRAGVVSAAAAVYGAATVAPERGVRLLQPWLTRSIMPQYRAWIMSDYAEYMAMGRHIDEARSLAEHACRVATYCGSPVELTMRRVDQQRVLLKSGLPEEAQRVMVETPQSTSTFWPKSYPYVRRALTLAEAHEQVGSLADASNWLQKAYDVIEKFDHERLRARAAIQSRQL